MEDKVEAEVKQVRANTAQIRANTKLTEAYERKTIAEAVLLEQTSKNT